MSKRILAILLILCMLVPCASASAESGGVVSMSMRPAFAGEIVELELALTDCSGFVNLGLEVHYDNTVMTLLEVRDHSGIGATCTPAQNIDANPYNIGWDSIQNVQYNGPLATFRFLISEHAPIGEHPVFVDFYKGRNGDYIDGVAVNYDENENPLNLTYVKGGVVVQPSPSSPDRPGGGGGISGGGGGGEIPADATVAKLSEAQGQRGEMVDVTLALSGNTGFVNLGLEVSYDNQVMQLLSVSDYTGVGATFTPAQSVNNNPYNVSWDAVSDVTYNGTLATFTFEIAEDAPIGEYPICLSFYRGRNGDYIDGISVNYDEDENPLDLYYVSGSIAVSYPPLVCPEPNHANTYNGNVYLVLDEAMSWQEASEKCEAAGGHLATATSAKENAFIQSLCEDGTSNQYYLGANSNQMDGIWSWITGESFVYSNWKDGSNGGFCLVLEKANGLWSAVDELTATNIGYVCEWEGEASGKESVYWVEFVSSKSMYAIGESFDVQVWMYTDDTVIQIFDEYTVSGFDSSQEGVCHVTVSYGDYSQTFEVEVVDTPEQAPVATYVVQSMATEGVTISPSGYAQVNDGTTMKFVIGAKDGYTIDGVSVNGEFIKLVDSNLSVMITEDTVVSVSGKKKTYSIESDAGIGGTILLSANTVSHGESCIARIVADDGYIISDVLVDGKSVGACKNYTFTNVRENHVITAVFEEVIETFTVRASAGEGGRVTPARSLVNSGKGVKLAVTPDYGYHPAYFLVDGKMHTMSSNEVVLDSITTDTNVQVVFAKDTFSVSATETEGAQISVLYNGENGQSLDVPYMDMVDIVIDLEDDYKLNTLYVNQVPVKAEKLSGRLVYRTMVLKNTVVSARCARTVTSLFQQEVANAGLAAHIHAGNAAEKKEEFMILAQRYTTLSEEEKVACTAAYATVLAALDRANAYLALQETDIVACIQALPSPDTLNEDNFRDWMEEIESASGKYEKLTYLSKSLIDYGYAVKLSRLKARAEELDRESKHIISYLYELIDAVPDVDGTDIGTLSEAHAKLVLAEETYYNLSEDNQAQVSDEKYQQLFDMRGRMSTQIHKLYVAPFTSKVLRSSGIMVTDSVANAEEKRVQIYDLMNEYHAFPAMIQKQIAETTLQKLNTLYENASVKVSTTVNELPVDMNGSFDEDVNLVLTEPELDDEEITTTTGKSVYQAIDVKMYSDNQEVQPTSKIRIKMEISKELSNADVSVVYIDDAGFVFDVQGDVLEESGKHYIVFFIDHFSSFAVLYDEAEAPETQITFDNLYPEVGDVLTASVTGAVNTADCKLWMVGYAEDGAVTFTQWGENGTVSGTVAPNTETVKAILWNKNLAPLIEPAQLSVF